MTDMIKALSTALDRLAQLDGIFAAVDRLQERVNHLTLSLELVQERLGAVDRTFALIEINGNGGEDLEDRIGEILDRKLDHVLEDAVTEALSGREITICL